MAPNAMWLILSWKL